MNKQLLSLFTLLLIVSGAAYFLYIQSMEQAPQKSLLFPSLAVTADKIDRVQISRADGIVIDARRTRDGWRSQLAETAIAYPIDQQALTELADSLTKAILFEAKTAKPENFSRLGLSDIEQLDSQATMIQIGAAGQSYSLLVGITSNSGQGSYIRQKDQNATWLLDRVIDLPTDKSDWLKQPVLDFTTQQVNAINRVDETPFSVIKEQREAGDFVLLNIPEGQSLKYETIVQGFVDNITSLNFEEIVSIEKDIWQAATLNGIFELSLEDGELINIVITELDEQYYVKFDSLDQADVPYWHGLTYKISSFAFGQLNKSMEDFVETAAVESENPPTPSIDEGEAPSGD